jgi:hypothetical protein
MRNYFGGMLRPGLRFDASSVQAMNGLPTIKKSLTRQPVGSHKQLRYELCSAFQVFSVRA